MVILRKFWGGISSRFRSLGTHPKNDKINEPETVVKVPSGQRAGALCLAMGGAEQQCQFIRQEQG